MSGSIAVHELARVQLRKVVVRRVAPEGCNGFSCEVDALVAVLAYRFIHVHKCGKMQEHTNTPE